MALELLVSLASACGVGFADFMTRLNSRFFSPLFLTTCISFIGVCLLLVYHLFFGTVSLFDVQMEQGALLLFAGVLNTIGLLLLYIGLQKGPVGIVSPAASISPVLVALQWAMVGVYPPLTAQIGLAVSCISLVLLGVFSAAPQQKIVDHAVMRFALIIGIAAAICLSLRMFLVQHVVQTVSPILSVLLVRASGTVVALILLLALCRRYTAVAALPKRHMWHLWPRLLVQGVPETLGVFAVFWASRGDYRTIAPALFSSSTLITILLARIFLQEKMPWRARVAACGVVIGAAIMTVFSA